MSKFYLNFIGLAPSCNTDLYFFKVKLTFAEPLMTLCAAVHIANLNIFEKLLGAIHVISETIGTPTF